jgi:hypothetical protein
MLINTLNTAWKMRLFMFSRLPGAWFFGIGVRSVTPERGEVTLPYGWRSKNPFRSTYFAAQCAAGELSTGLLAMLAMENQPPVSMLVTRVESEFYKKADKTLLFTCEDGAAMAETIQKAIKTGESYTFRAVSTGRLPDGTEASKVWVTWSFKVKTKQ